MVKGEAPCALDSIRESARPPKGAGSGRGARGRGGGTVGRAAGPSNKDVQPEPFALAESFSLVSRVSLDHLRHCPRCSERERERERGMKPGRENGFLFSGDLRN